MINHYFLAVSRIQTFLWWFQNVYPGWKLPC